MSKLTKPEIVDNLKILGELAHANGEQVELLVVGGAFMILAFDARSRTQDIDALFINPEQEKARRLAQEVALERNLPEDWLNDASKVFVQGVSRGEVLLESTGILVRAPSLPQVLAMKLSAWRGDLDISDALFLLEQLAQSGRSKEEIWEATISYLVPTQELKAQYAFETLWEQLANR